jgi:HAE1 family hydrophobic/amphiphilic exporter-1
MLTKLKTCYFSRFWRITVSRLSHAAAALVFGALLATGALAQTVPTVQPTQPVSPNPQPVQTPQVQATPPATTQPTPQPGATPVVQPTPTRPTQNVGGSQQTELPPEPPEIAPNYVAPVRPLPSTDRVGVDATDLTPMTLQEAIALALENNTEIETSRIDVRVSEFDLRGARGVYDPRLVGESYFQRATTPTASTLGSSTGSTTSTGFVNNLGLSGFSPFAGGSYRAQFNSSRQTTDAPFTALNPQFPSSLTLSYTQPLFRGLRIDDNRRRIQIARKNLSLTDAQFRLRAIDVISRVTTAYWDLAYALRNLQVQIDAVRQARAQSESNRRKVQEGTLAPIDIVAADTQVTNFEQNVYTAQEQVTRAEATLKTLLLPDKNAPLWSRALVPTTPVTLEAPRAGFTDALSAAYANRPEIQQLQTSREINEIDARYFRDQTKPQVDLVGSVTSAGLAGSLVQSSGANPLTSSFGPLIDRVNVLSANEGLPPIQFDTTSGGALPGNLVGGYGQSLGNLAALRYPTYQIGVRIDLPLGNRTAKANLGRSLAEGSRIETQRNQTEQQIKSDVQTALQSLRSAEARLASAAASRGSTEQLYESEKRRLESGTSTLYLVLQRQQELVVARSNELQAQTELNKSIANFQRATGSTFEANKVDIGPETSRNLRMTVPVGDSFTPSAIRSSLNRQTGSTERRTEISSADKKP